MASQQVPNRFTPLALSSRREHPRLIYGTAFKGDQTYPLTAMALEHGFKGLDSANYPTAYQEVQVGDAIQQALKGGVKREDILVQSKFTPAWAHAKGKIPFKTDQPLEQQVRESIEQSFKNLQVDYIDAFLLHVPFEQEEDNITAWRVFETFVPDKIGVLGVSNFPLPAFEKLFNGATIKPEIVQNRFHEKNGYDIGLREFLREKGVVYQAFHLLKANTEIISSDLVARFSEQFSVEKEISFYLLVLSLGKVSIVNGTTSEGHMVKDIEAVNRILGDEQKAHAINAYVGEFEALIQKVGGKARINSHLA